jgi:hypothetical protein
MRWSRSPSLWAVSVLKNQMITRLRTMAVPAWHAIGFATCDCTVFAARCPQRIVTPLQVLAAVVLLGVQRGIDLGIADFNRLGVMGRVTVATVLWLSLEQSSRFRAAGYLDGYGCLLDSVQEL